MLRSLAQMSALSLTLCLLIGRVAAYEWQVCSKENLPSPGAGTLLQRMKAVEISGAKAELTCLVFDEKNCLLRVVDRPDPSSPKLGPSMRAGGFLCGVNGGFFTKNFEPLGWVVSQGRELSPLLRTKLLTGAYFFNGHRGQLLRTAELKKGLRATEALQAGPFLIDGGRPVVGLEATRPAARTFLATNGADVWVIGVIFSPTLAEAASLLATDGIIDGLHIHRALNLDGGRSSGFWAAQPEEKVLSYEEISAVRNYLGVIAKSVN